MLLSLRSQVAREIVHRHDIRRLTMVKGMELKLEIDHESFLTAKSKRRKPSPIRALQPLVSQPGMISLGGGMPNTETFPFASLQLNLKSGKQLTLDTDRLHEALQYSPTPGLPSLLAALRRLQLREHTSSRESDFDITVTTGSQDGLSKAFDMLLEEDDTLLLESPTYSGSLAYLQALHCNLQSVETDAQGLVPDSLRNILLHWETSHPGRKRPRVLYVIPTGGNPTGASLTLARKEEILNLAHEYNLLILEDDPYYYLRFDIDDDVRGDQKSLMYLDQEHASPGRVLRFDSFSKILSSGMRIGWITGPAKLLDQINLHSQASNLHVCGVSQSLVSTLLGHWGQDGWSEHVASVRQVYLERRDVMLECLERHLGRFAEWNVPSAGMFIWIKLLGIDDTEVLIKEKAVAHRVLLVPGKVFMPDPDAPCAYVRAAYSTASFDEMNLAMERLATLLDQYRQDQRKKMS